MGWENSNDFLFAGNDSGSNNFGVGEEKLNGDDFCEDNNLLDIDPYRGDDVIEKITKVLEKKEIPKELEFKTVEINGETIEYLDLDKFYTYSEIIKYAQEKDAKLPNEKELRDIIKVLGVKKITKKFPGHIYSDGKIIGGKGLFVQYWLNSDPSLLYIDAIMIVNGKVIEIYKTSIPKDCGIYACLIKK